MLYYQSPSKLSQQEEKILKQFQQRFHNTQKQTKVISSSDYLFFCFFKLRKILYQGQSKIQKDEKDSEAIQNQVFRQTFKYFSNQQFQKIYKLDGISVKYQVNDKLDKKQHDFLLNKLKQVVNSIKDQFIQFFLYFNQVNQTSPKKNYNKVDKLYQIVHQKMNLFYPIREDIQKDLKTVKILNSYMKQLLLSISIIKDQKEKPSQQKMQSKAPIKKKKIMSDQIKRLKQQLQKNDEEFVRVKGQFQNKIDIMQLKQSKYEMELQRTIDVRRRGLDIWISSV